jgi:hypothetical protein
VAIHVDVSARSLNNLRKDAKNRGLSVRDLASKTLEDVFNGDRSVFIFTPAMPPEMLPQVELIMDTAMRNKDMFQKFLEMAEERKKNDQTQSKGKLEAVQPPTGG